MDLVLWRHAQAHDLGLGDDDLNRSLTLKGEKQAARMAAWLDRQLPEGTRILASPALRADQTAQALQRKFKLREELLPTAGPDDLLQLVQWPGSKGTVLVVGHQPTLGQVAAQLLGIPLADLAIKKGAVWWLRTQHPLAGPSTLLLTVQSPETL